LNLPFTSATATVSSGFLTQSNTGHPCRSGTLIHIDLIGDFHEVLHGGVVGPPYEPTTAVLITADPESGQAVSSESRPANKHPWPARSPSSPMSAV